MASTSLPSPATAITANAAFPPPLLRCCRASQCAGAATKVSVPPSCRLRSQSGHRRCCATTNALPPPRCSCLHQHHAAAAANAALSSSCRCRRQAGHQAGCRTSATAVATAIATTIALVSTVIIVAVIAAVFVAVVVAAFSLLLIVVCAPTIAATASVFIAPTVERGGSTTVGVAAAAMPAGVALPTHCPLLPPPPSCCQQANAAATSAVALPSLFLTCCCSSQSCAYPKLLPLPNGLSCAKKCHRISSPKISINSSVCLYGGVFTPIDEWILGTCCQA